MLFEDVWTSKGKVFVREQDATKKSKKRETHYKSEYYLKDPLGEYRGLLDNEPLRKVQGSAYGVDNAYGERTGKYVVLRDEYFSKGMYNKNPGSFFLDIETSVGTVTNGFPYPEEALEPIVLVQFWDTTTNQGYVLGLEEWHHQKDYHYDFDLKYIKYNSEKDLLLGFIDLFKSLDPLIIYAWNGSNFDFPYIFNRLKNIGINTNNLSNYSSAHLKTTTLKNNQVVYDVISPGHVWLDLLDVYKKFVFKNVPNYTLDTIGFIEAGINKVQHDNYLKFDDFRTGKYYIHGNETPEIKETKLYKCALLLKQNPNHPKKKSLEKYIKEKSYSDFVHYGVQDFVVLKAIHDAQNFTSLMVTMAEQMGCTLQDTLGTIVPWSMYIGNISYKKKQIMPAKKHNGSKVEVTGGFVKDPEVGKHRWLVSTDYASMYPMNITAFNLSPECKIEYEDLPPELQSISKIFETENEDIFLKFSPEQWNQINKVIKKHNVSVSIGGGVYDITKEGFVPKLVKEIYLNRKEAKKKMWKHSNNANDIRKELNLRKK